MDKCADSVISSSRPSTAGTQRSSTTLAPHQPTSSPTTIILALWPLAYDEQISYYTTGYQTLYPTAHIILLPSSRQSSSRIDAVLNNLITGDDKQTSLDEKHESTQTVILHLFGDHAAAQACHLLRAYYLRTQRALPIGSVIHDTAPAAKLPSLRILRSGRPLSFISTLFFTLIAMTWQLLCDILPFSNGMGAVGASLSAQLHDPRVVADGVRRCYVLPDTKTMFSSWSPVGSPHADHTLDLQHDGVEDFDDATAAQRTKFVVDRNAVGSHERGWSGHQERYWAAVDNAWSAWGR
jgi:hypothetical protein